jgi:TolA-binding protein
MSDKLAEDWVALWQSELTGMAADRELRESYMALVTLWGATATAALGTLRATHESPYRNTVAPQPPRTAAPHAAPVPGLDEIEQLNRRIAELEQRLAAFERDRARPD